MNPRSPCRSVSLFSCISQFVTIQPFTASIKKDTIAHSNLVLTLERSFNFHTLANPLYPMELAQIALLLLGLSFGC